MSSIEKIYKGFILGQIRLDVYLIRIVKFGLNFSMSNANWKWSKARTQILEGNIKSINYVTMYIKSILWIVLMKYDDPSLMML